MSDTKYFTPQIEDIRVGYECEIWWNWNHLPENEWCPVKVWDTNTEDFDLYDFTYRVKTNEIRVPYLTKEQIEAEGWVEKQSNHDKGYLSWFEKDNYFMSFYEYEKIIMIGAKDVTKIEWLDILRHDEKWGHNMQHTFRVICPCKDINTFRYICKLLNID